MSDQRHWCSSPFVDIAMNSECSAAICVNRTGVSFSGHSSRSSDIHSGEPDDDSFFLESEMLHSDTVSLLNYYNIVVRLTYHSLSPTGTRPVNSGTIVWDQSIVGRANG